MMKLNMRWSGLRPPLQRQASKQAASIAVVAFTPTAASASTTVACLGAGEHDFHLLACLKQLLKPRTVVSNG